MDAPEPAGPEAVGRRRIERALAGDELALFCQPIRDLRGGGYPMAELLVRMRDEEHALVPPGEFLPVFEEHGMMPQLDRWVVSHALRCLRRGSRIPALSINLSGQTLADASFPAFVEKELQASGGAQGALLFEIDESELATAMDGAVRTATALRAAGCRVIIDSFGATARSLVYLRHLRAEFVKIDGAIVRKLLTSAGARSILEAIMRIAGTLDIGVIGSCVEEQDVLLRLKAYAVGYVQGFGVYQPGPLEKLAG